MAVFDVDEILDVVVSEITDPLDLELLGPTRHILCYKKLDGSVPALEFLDSQSKSTKARYALSFRKHAQGLTLRGEKHHPLTEAGCDGLYEYKDIDSKTRLFHRTERKNRFILLNGLTGKKENKFRGTSDVNEAKRLRDEYQVRKEQRFNELRNNRKK